MDQLDSETVDMKYDVSHERAAVQMIVKTVKL